MECDVHALMAIVGTWTLGSDSGPSQFGISLKATPQMPCIFQALASHVCEDIHIHFYLKLTVGV